MVELVDTEALKASDPQGSCGFESHSRHQNIAPIINNFQDINFLCTCFCTIIVARGAYVDDLQTPPEEVQICRRPLSPEVPLRALVRGRGRGQIYPPFTEDEIVGTGRGT